MDIKQARAALAIAALAFAGKSIAQSESPVIVDTRGLLADQGWVDGRNLALGSVDIVNAPKAEAEARAAEVIVSRPNAILMIAAAEMALFQRLTKDVPVVFYNLAVDPARIGLVDSLRRPGGNFTGTSHNRASHFRSATTRATMIRVGGHTISRSSTRSSDPAETVIE